MNFRNLIAALGLLSSVAFAGTSTGINPDIPTKEPKVSTGTPAPVPPPAVIKCTHFDKCEHR